MNNDNIFKKDFSSIFAVIDIDNIDTDMIIPKQFLKTTSRIGLGKYLFYEKRYNKNGEKNSNFVLNKDDFKNAEILVAGKNFGCGSSREHAPWALKDFGIKVIIAESFADIFYNNCFENLILPIGLNKDEIGYIKNFSYLNNDKININMNKITINLEKQQVICSEKKFHFKIDDAKKFKILNQIDTINEILKKEKLIEEFELKNDI